MHKPSSEQRDNHSAPTDTVEITVLMTPDFANFNGHVHGGQIMRLLDQAAYVCAGRYSGYYAVTVMVHDISFKASIKVGQLVTFKAAVNFSGKTSMEIGIKVVAQNIQTQEETHTNSAYFTMVALDATGQPTAVPLFTPKTIDQKRRYENACTRKARHQNVIKKSEY